MILLENEVQLDRDQFVALMVLAYTKRSWTERDFRSTLERGIMCAYEAGKLVERAAAIKAQLSQETDGPRS